MKRTTLFALLVSLATLASGQTNAELKEQVRKTEIAFAKTLADRNPTAFASFLTADSVFMSNGKTFARPRRSDGPMEALFRWCAAPFSWAPEFVEVLNSGTLALSTGPVLDPTGKRIGTFNSVWRREKGVWKIVLDNGCPRLRLQVVPCLLTTHHSPLTTSPALAHHPTPFTLIAAP